MTDPISDIHGVDDMDGMAPTEGAAPAGKGFARGLSPRLTPRVQKAEMAAR